MAGGRTSAGSRALLSVRFALAIVGGAGSAGIAGIAEAQAGPTVC